ncbi:MAG: ferredoxin [Cyclobacteriaceae bacterium]
MESNKIAPEGQQIRWKVEEPASSFEMDSFWKELRHFYRTGEKKVKDESPEVSSALVHLLEDAESPYPHSMRGEKELSISLDERTPYLILNHILNEKRKENQKKFKNRLSELITGLNNLLHVEDKSADTRELEATYDFADEMIAFDKLVAMIPHSSGEALPEERLKRLKGVLATLTSALAYFSDQVATIVAEKEFVNKAEDEAIFQHSMLITADKDPFLQTQQLFSKEIQSFSEIIKAYRIATLEVNGEYHDAVHNEYFEHFTWHRLLENELNLFHPIVLLIGHEFLFDHLTSFSRLLASNQPVNILVLNHELISVPGSISWEDASHQFRQEPAALTISHRNVYTLQAGMDDPSFLYKGLENCLKSVAPGVCHLSLSMDDSRTEAASYLIARGETAGRYFPKILYDPLLDKEWSERFDMSQNIQSDTKWPLYSMRASTSEETEAMIDVAFTYADYKAIFPEKAEELMLIPSQYYTEHLVPLADYLELDEERLYGKIPFIWLVDLQMNLYRAAVPNVWVVSCQERLDFWSFLQEIGGINKHHTRQALESREVDMQKMVADTKATIEAEYQQKISRIEEEAVGKAAEQLIAVLLDEEDIQVNSIPSTQEDGDAEPSASTEEKEEISTPVVEREEAPAIEEAWVESDDCTTCNECTDKFPNLFKYNDDKQAYIEDASKGTYAEIVKAAENCPAACIHPGLPLNQNEPNLDALIKRAEKFN